MMNGKRPEWYPDWHGECVAIVGAGPSLTKADVDKLRDRIRVIAVNTSYQLCTWADAMYCCDAKWWDEYRGAKEFTGLKIGFENNDHTLNFPDVRRIKIKGWQRRTWVNEIVMDDNGEIGSGANSAYQASNLAAQFGAKALLLLGLDMMDGSRNQTHWHGRHQHPLYNPIRTNFDEWIKHFRNAAPMFARLGIDVVNCTAQSALQGYPRMSIEDAFKRWGL